MQVHYKCVCVEVLFEDKGWRHAVDRDFNLELYARHQTRDVNVHIVDVREIPKYSPKKGVDKRELLGYHVAIYYTLKE